MSHFHGFCNFTNQPLKKKKKVLALKILPKTWMRPVTHKKKRKKTFGLEHTPVWLITSARLESGMWSSIFFADPPSENGNFFFLSSLKKQSLMWKSVDISDMYIINRWLISEILIHRSINLNFTITGIQKIKRRAIAWGWGLTYILSEYLNC